MPIFSRFGADFFTVYADFSRFVRDINGGTNISLSMSFFTVSFSRFAPSRNSQGPTGNKRCFLNGDFQSGVLRGWSGSTRAEGTEMLEKHGCFQAFFLPLKAFTFVASRG